MKIVRYLRALSVRLLLLLNLPFSILLLLSYLAPIIPPTSNSYLAILALGFPFCSWPILLGPSFGSLEENDCFICPPFAFCWASLTFHRPMDCAFRPSRPRPAASEWWAIICAILIRAYTEKSRIGCRNKIAFWPISERKIPIFWPLKSALVGEELRLSAFKIVWPKWACLISIWEAGAAWASLADIL